MNTFDWRNFLTTWNREILDQGFYGHYVYYYRDLPTEAITSGWIGYPPVDEEQIIQVEEKLAVALPFTYKAFLKVSNGWLKPNPAINRLSSVTEINWFAQTNPAWIEILSDFSYNVSNEVYFVYGEKQNEATFRLEYLQAALQISDIGDQTVYLLNPKVVTLKGEWEAWIFSAWGVIRYPSFQEMMQAEYERFLQARNEKLPEE